jgi:hypothetical protein
VILLKPAKFAYREPADIVGDLMVLVTHKNQIRRGSTLFVCHRWVETLSIRPCGLDVADLPNEYTLDIYH